MSNLISDEYQKQCQQLHEEDPSWGVASIKEAPMVAAIINKLGINSVIDYGAGKCRLGKAMREHLDHKISLVNYDPGVPEISEIPEPAEMVACIDVLEHIEQDRVDAVLDDIARLTQRCAYVTISCQPAKRILPDGRNAHITLHPPHWWLEKLDEKFLIGQFMGDLRGFAVMLKPKVK